MSFHLGKPILVMLILALAAGMVSLSRPNQRKANTTMWVFADSHRKSYEKPVQTFQQRNHTSVNLNLIFGLAMDMRLNSLFMTDPTSDQLPDIAELEIGWIGKYFRPPLKEVG